MKQTQALRCLLWLAIFAVLVAPQVAQAEPPGDLDLVPPPGDVTVREIKFVDQVPAGTLKQVDGQYALLARTFAKNHKTAKYYADQTKKTLYVVGADLVNGLAIRHDSDCAINSQFKFTAPVTLTEVPASLGEIDADPGFRDELVVAQRPDVKELLYAWTRSRHAAPNGIKFEYRPSSTADVTLNAAQLKEHRVSQRARSSGTYVLRE